MTWSPTFFEIWLNFFYYFVFLGKTRLSEQRVIFFIATVKFFEKKIDVFSIKI